MSDQHAHDAPDVVSTGAELTALDPAFRTDPYPVLARLRAREPVHYMRIFTRFHEFSMLFQDPPAHTRLRLLARGRRNPGGAALQGPDRIGSDTGPHRAGRPVPWRRTLAYAR